MTDIKSIFPNMISHDMSLQIKRVEYIDMAKGIGILMILLLHTGLGLPLTPYIAMPMFFVIAGMFFKDKGFGYTAKSKVVRLLIPVVVFNIIGMVYHYLESVFLSDSPIEFDILGSAFFLHNYNAPLWFLFAMFLDYMIFMILHRITRNIWILCLLVITLTSVAFIDTYIHIYFRQSLISMPFFFMGYCLKSTRLVRDADRSDWRICLVSLIILILCYLFSNFIYSTDIGFVQAKITGNVPIFYIESMLCVIATMLICRSIGWLPLLSYMGQFSLIIVCVHLLYVNFMSHIAQKFIVDSSMWCYFVFFMATILSIVSIPILRKYFPYFVGEKSVL